MFTKFMGIQEHRTQDFYVFKKGRKIIKLNYLGLEHEAKRGNDDEIKRIYHEYQSEIRLKIYNDKLKKEKSQELEASEPDANAPTFIAIEQMAASYQKI